MKIICETERLSIRQFNKQDTAFIIRLLNEETFIQNIADKKVRNQADALNYLTNGPISSYQKNGFGLNIVLLKGTNTPIGMCGLLKRDELDFPDLGYALLPEYCAKGYAYEASTAVLNHEMSSHSLIKVLAVTFPSNFSSNGLLKKIGFKLAGKMELYSAQNNLYEYEKLKQF